jgi:GMP synthase (glutamine-hydrolysing)
MKNLLIIKTGDTFPEIKAAHGDFEDMFASSLEGIDVDITVYDARDQQPLLELAKFQVVIITGSHSMSTDCELWSERLLPYIREMLAIKTPTLGVCYGHQLIAKALGGEIDFHPEGPQAGSTEITLTEAGKADQLLGKSPKSFKVNAGNSQRISKLPNKAVVLAGNDFEPHQAIRFSEAMWGLQFHPEFGRDVTCAYIDRTADVLSQHGRDSDKIKTDCIDTIESQELLKSFARIIT